MALAFIKLLLVCLHGVCRRGCGHGLCSPAGPLGEYSFAAYLQFGWLVTWGGVPKPLMVGRSAWLFYFILFYPGKIATASCGASYEVPDGSAGRSFCWHTLMGCLVDGSVVTWGVVMKFYDGYVRCRLSLC